jgi:sugar phosphate permease
VTEPTRLNEFLMTTSPTDLHPAELPGRATRVRYLVVGLTMLTSLLLYLDRYCISISERLVKEDLGLSNEQIAWVLSAFFWTYALAQVPSGFLSDRYGPRLMLTLYVLLWSMFLGLIGLATGFLMLLAFRFGFGLAQAGAYPTSAVLVARWVPLTARGSASGLIAVGGRVGAFLAPILTALLIVQFVPLSVSSRLTADDVLDYPNLCYHLLTDRTVLASGTVGGLPDWAARAVDRDGTLYARALALQKERNIPLAQALGEVGLQPTSRELRDVVAWRFNHLLRIPTLPEHSGLKAAVLPREAQALLERAPGQLTTDERERLNRLVLETAYPQAIRKVYVAGWRPVMVVFALAGLAVAALFWFLTRDDPMSHPRCNAAEVQLIHEGRPPESSFEKRRASRVPLGALVRSGSMWLMCLAQMGTNVGWVFLVTWLPRYLAEVHKIPIEERGLLASIPLLVGWAGMMAGGWATDTLAQVLGTRWGRALPLALSRFVAMGAYAVCLFGVDAYTATLAFAVVAFATDFGLPATWAFNLDVGGRHVGSVLGWGNMWGNFGAALSPPLLNWVVGPDRWWDGAFLACGAAFLVAGVCALGINAAAPLVRPEGRGA